MARAARLQPRNLKAGFGTLGRFFKGNFQVVPKIGPALRSASASAKDIAETEHLAEPAENVLEAGEHAGIEAGCGAAEAGVSEAIVQVPLVGIG